MPHFLIIGAMKSGTTTLYRDLLKHSSIFFPVDKEPGNLIDPGVLTEAGRVAYARLFSKAAVNAVCGEASTIYTKLPDFTGAAEQARKLLGPDLKIIYIMREPVSRTLSHHYHNYCIGTATSDVNQAVFEDPQFLNYSRYAMQLEPWVSSFGREAILPVRFEDYIADRRAGAASVWRFLGVDPRPELVDDSIIYNDSKKKPASRGFLYWLSRGTVYRQFVRPLLSESTKDKLRKAFLPQVPAKPSRPSLTTLQNIAAALKDDQIKLANMLEGFPLWTVEESWPSTHVNTNQRSVERP
jgi:hypothetical protein